MATYSNWEQHELDEASGKELDARGILKPLLTFEVNRDAFGRAFLSVAYPDGVRVEVAEFHSPVSVELFNRCVADGKASAHATGVLGI